MKSRLTKATIYFIYIVTFSYFLGSCAQVKMYKEIFFKFVVHVICYFVFLFEFDISLYLHDYVEERVENQIRHEYG